MSNYTAIWKRSSQQRFKVAVQGEVMHAIIHWMTSPLSSTELCQVNQGYGPCIADIRDAQAVTVIVNKPLCHHCKYDIDEILKAAPELCSSITRMHAIEIPHFERKPGRLK